MTISPARTIAVVIGVERYAIGRSWDLDGPALDAARFTRWLVDRGVGPERIHLLAAPLPQNEEEFARLLETTGVRPKLVRELFG